METFEYKCPSCGAAVKFDSDSQKMKCPYCKSELDMESLKSYDEALNDNVEDKTSWDDKEENFKSFEDGDEINNYSCNSCGGEILSEATTAATSCPYCGNPVIVIGKLAGELKPDVVIPFKLDKEDALKSYAKFLKRKPLLPKEFKDIKKFEEVKGLYVPFWLYDCDADAKIRYKATRTHYWSDSTYNYTKTSHYYLIREGNLSFEKVPVDGSKKMDDAFMESIEPYNFEDAVDFQTAYLAGFLADKYDVNSQESEPRANERIKASTVSTFSSTTIGYSTCYPESTNIKLSHGKVTYAFFPVWMLNTKFKGKIYSFAMNGQTGKFVGKLPIDIGKAILWFASAFAAATLIATLILRFVL